MLINSLSRTARSLLGWTQEDLAAKSGVSVASVKRFEAGSTSPIPAVEGAMSEAFKDAGIAFLDRNAVHEGRKVVAGVILFEKEP